MVIILAILTLWNIFAHSSYFSPYDHQGSFLPEGNYTSTAYIMSDEQEYYGEENMAISVVNDSVSLNLTAEYNKNQKQCIGSTLYALGTIVRHKDYITVDFVKVVEKKVDNKCLSKPTRSYNLTQSVNGYARKEFVLRSIYRDESTECVETEFLGGLCLTKE